MEIIDNFLPEEVFRKIQLMFYREDFPWFWNNAKSTEGESFCDELDNYQFVHTFYNDLARRSTWDIEPIVKKLEPKALVRIKANLNPRTSEIVKFGFHIDNRFDCKTAIYYINTNDGYTEFVNGKKVESVENRMVIFDSSLGHTGTSCTNEKRRIVLNFNYF